MIGTLPSAQQRSPRAGNVAAEGSPSQGFFSYYRLDNRNCSESRLQRTNGHKRPDVCHPASNERRYRPMFHRYKINPHERGLLFKEGDLVTVLGPGVHWYLDSLMKRV
jgi:hypothetical protein